MPHLPALALLVLAATASGASHAAELRYAAQEITTPDGASIDAEAMNQAGQLTGRTHGRARVTPERAQGVVVGLDGGYAAFRVPHHALTTGTAINEAGWVAGTTDEHAFLRAPDGTLTLLPHITAGVAGADTQLSEARAINASQVVVGTFRYTTPMDPLGFVWQGERIVFLTAIRSTTWGCPRACRPAARAR